MGVSRSLAVDFKGIVTAPGLLMRSEASFTQALNCLFDAPGLVRRRPGFLRLSNNFGGSIFQVHASPLLNDRVITHFGSLTPQSLRVGTGTSPSTALALVGGGNITRPLTLKQQMALGGRNHYLTATEGLIRVQELLTFSSYAGMPRGMPPSQESGSLTVLQALTPTWLPDASSVAYRVTWHRFDDSRQELGGAPTGRAVVRNINGTTGWTGTARSVVIRLPVPREFGTINAALTTSYFWRLWRSRSAIADPDDEMFLVAEAYLTAGDIASGFVDVPDVTPNEVLVGNPRLHTNPVNFPPGEANLVNGILNADDPPPRSNDVASWRECLWCADVSYRPSYTSTLVSVGGLVAGSTISLDGINTLTAVVGLPGAGQFSLVTTLPTASLNVEATVRNIVDQHNRLYARLGTSPVFAYYVSVGSAAPGTIYVEAKQHGASIVPTTSFAASWRGYLATGALTAVPSAGGTNVLTYSKANRPDAMAPVNTLTVGPAQCTILRIVPYRDRLLVFTDLGIYQVTGSTWGSFAVEPFDLTFRLIGRQLVAVSDDKVYAWCVEGIVEIDEAGVRVISSPIEPTLTAIVAGAGAALANYGFTMGYRFQHRVVFMYPEISGIGVQGCTTGLIFDTRTQAWSTMLFGPQGDYLMEDLKSCGVVRFSDDRLVLGWVNPGGGDGWLFEERRTLTSADYDDSRSDGTLAKYDMTLAMQFQIPDTEGAVHWQQTVFHLDGGEFAWRGYATALDVVYFSEAGFVASSSTGVTGPLVRIEPPQAARRSNRLSMVVTMGGADGTGLIGVSQGVRIGTRFARRA